MTARHQTLLVTFDEPIREDDLQTWINAIRLMDRVVDVEPAEVGNLELHAARMQLRDDAYDAWKDVFDL